MEPEEVERFMAEGFIAVRAAIEPDVLRACRCELDEALRRRGIDPDDRATWRAPVVRFDCPVSAAFGAAGNTPPVIAAIDALLGGEWRRRLDTVGGTVPVRFPSERDPGDAGWHVDGSFEVAGQYWVDVRSRGRGLLALYLFSDVGEDDAPTELIVGSHLDVPRVLLPFGDRGTAFGAVADMLPATTWQRRRVLATGRAGDVLLCHPFLVHRATWPHRGDRPRMIAQPEIGAHAGYALREPGTCAVERAILRALADG